MTGLFAPSRWRRRPAVVLLAVGVIVVTLIVAVSRRPVDLAEVLLVLVVEVIGLSLVAGRALAAVTRWRCPWSSTGP